MRLSCLGVTGLLVFLSVSAFGQEVLETNTVLLEESVESAEWVETVTSNDMEVIEETDTNGDGLFLENVIGEEPYDDGRVVGEVSWDNSFSLGLSQTLGNSELMIVNGAFSFDRTRLWINQITWTGTFDYRENATNVTYRKITSKVRYGHSFNVQLYGFLSFTVEHDLSSSIDYSLYPTAGIGYWLWDTDVFGSVVELGGSYRYTSYSVSPYVVEKKALYINSTTSVLITDEVELSEDLDFRPEVDFSSFLLESETELTIEMTERLNLSVVYNFDYNSAPVAGNVNSDHSFDTLLEWEL